MGRRHKLTAKDVGKKSRKTGVVSDGDGLYLSTSKTLSQSWVYRYKKHGKEHRIGLGSSRDVSLAEARRLAEDARKAVKGGRDPRSKDSITFKEAAAEYIKAHSPGWRNAKHKQQWENTLETYAEPVFGHLPVNEIDLDLVLRVIQPIWSAKTETASRVRMRIENILAWATVKGYRSGFNPAVWRGNLDAVLPSKDKIQRVQHHPALPYAELPGLFPLLSAINATGARAVCFAILTGARSGEVRYAAWDEIQDDLWVIPAERMKAGREHRVPLSNAALEILEQIEKSGDHIFTGPRGKPISDMTMGKLLKSRRGGVTVHGFRSTFRDWVAEETNYPNHIAEMALAHSIGSQVEAAYRRGDLLQKRRELMEAWADYVTTDCMEVPASHDEFS
ncbi:MAG: integrase arm-type DNA-binding domain-containing protein [Halioglobus sp.]